MDFGLGDLRDILRDGLSVPDLPPILPRSLFLLALLTVAALNLRAIQALI